VINEMLEM